MEVWEEISGFPEYVVSDRGVVANARTGRTLVQSKNPHGVVFVILRRDNKPHSRAVSRLVAEAFIPNENDSMDTPMHLDNNREHNYVENLVWRTRSFVHTYKRQFVYPYQNRIKFPIVVVQTGEQFSDSWEPCIKYGLLERAVVMSVLNDWPVYPTSQIFRLLSEFEE